MRRRRYGGAGLPALALAVMMAGCGDDSGTPPDPGPDPALEPFVGTWEADSLVVTSSGDSTIVVNVIDEGGTLTLNITEGGNYTLTLAYAGSPIISIGTVTVEGDVIISRPSGGGPPEPLTYDFPSSDRLVLSGGISFPFTSATPTPGELYTEMFLR